MTQQELQQHVSRGAEYVSSFRIQSVKDKVLHHTYYRKTTGFIKKRPIASFLVSLVALFAVIALAGALSKKPVEETAVDRSTRSVATYQLGAAPKVSLQAQIEKSGVVQIVAQTPGIVQEITLKSGDSVQRGTKILNLSSNYQGGNAPAIQTAIAQAQYKNVIKTYDTQKELIAKQREVAQKSDENTTQLQDISRDSIDQTRNLLDLNKQNVQSVIQAIQNLETNPPGPGYAGPTIESLRGTQAQIQAGINQLETGLANLEYSTNTQNPPTDLARLQKEITLKGLDVQEKGLELQKKVSGLQVSLAAIGESLMYPASPYAGTIERIFVKEGQLVNPGTPLAVIKSNAVVVKLVANAPQHIAQSVSELTPSTIHIQNTTLSEVPSFISSEATNGQLYTIEYSIPEEYSSTVTDSEFVTIDIPLRSDQTLTNTPYIPIDAVFQTQQEAYVNVITNDIAQVRKLKLGNVYGEYVEVLSGLSAGDKVILDRNVLAGDRVSAR